MVDYIELNLKNTDYLLSITTEDRYEKLKKSRYSKQLNMLKNHINSNDSILDIGIRDGAFLNYLKENGFNNLYGIDIHTKSVALCNKKGISAEVANAQEFDLGKTFDVIIMSHVLEHCPNPDKVIKRVEEHINDFGILFIEVPRELGKPRPTEKDAHYYNFESYRSLIELFDDKWEVVDRFVSDNRIKVVLRRNLWRLS